MITSMTRLLVASLLLSLRALTDEPAFVGFSAARPADWTVQPATVTARQPYGNFRLSFTFAGNLHVQLGASRFPVSGAGRALLTANGLGVQLSVNGQPTTLSRSVRMGPVILLAAGQTVRLQQLEITALPPGPALGEDISSLLPDFAQRTGPQGLLLLFVRSADW